MAIVAIVVRTATSAAAARTNARIACASAETVMGEPETEAAPNINSITPNVGPLNTATAVTIGGVGFTGATSVTFGAVAATSVVVVSDTQITCATPLVAADQVVDVTVVTPGGNNTMFNGFTFEKSKSDAFFPAFVPIIPPPPIGAAHAVPTFPPPTPPPIGAVPVGPLVGPAIAPATVPPSLAGVVQPQYKTGSATAPAANGYFPQFTTTTAYAGFPNNPPAGVPIVFSNISTNPSRSGGVWTVVPPPSTPTTAQITLNGMSILVPHDVGSVRDGYEEFAERSAGPVFSGNDTAHLHQSQSPKDRRRKRLPAGDPGGRANGT